jgi:sulfur-oxidizing protein SoxY
VRGAVQLADGAWLVSGGWIDAAGGGCSAPPVSRVRGDWAQHLGEMRGAAWPMEGGRPACAPIRHPMDTGFVANIPTYNIETLRFTSPPGGAGRDGDLGLRLGRPGLHPDAPRGAGDVLEIAARDSNGRDYTAPLSWEACMTVILAAAACWAG